MSQLASIQYDIYQRYTILAASFDAVFPARKKPFRVLDVGSGPESLAKRFLDGRFEVISCDVDDFGNPAIVKLQPGQPLPFADGAFDAVVCMDVLEHMPEAARPPFLAELARVASGLVVVAFPHSDDGVRQGERLLDRGYLDLWGMHCDFLVEHEEFGLPRLSEAEAALAASGLATARMGVSRLDEWLLYSYMDILCLSLFGVGVEKEDLNRRFNDVARPGRDPEGYYRAMIFASRDARMVKRLEATFFGATPSPSIPLPPSFAVAVNAFDASRYIADRLRSKSFQDVYLVVAHDLARLAGSQQGVDALSSVPTSVEQLARSLGEIQHSISERAAQETVALSGIAESISTNLARQVELHELRTKEVTTRLEECAASLAQVSGSLADVRAERDALADKVYTLTRELTLQEQTHEAELRDALGRLEERTAALYSTSAELAQARRTLLEVTAFNEALSRDLEEARGRIEEHAASLEAERSAGQARLQHVKYMLDVQTVASGKMSARLRCEKRARLLDIRQVEALARRS